MHQFEHPGTPRACPRRSTTPPANPPPLSIHPPDCSPLSQPNHQPNHRPTDPRNQHSPDQELPGEQRKGVSGRIPARRHRHRPKPRPHTPSGAEGHATNPNGKQPQPGRLEKWARADSNCRPHPYQGCALPTELLAQNVQQITAITNLPSREGGSIGGCGGQGKCQGRGGSRGHNEVMKSRGHEEVTGSRRRQDTTIERGQKSHRQVLVTSL
jgi:hypothetical protein